MNKIYFCVALAGALLLMSPAVHAQDMVWPQFLGPQSNPVGAHAKLADRWSKTENVEAHTAHRDRNRWTADGGQL